MGIKAMVVDDEPWARCDVRELARLHGGVDIVWEAGLAATARLLLHEVEPELLLLDVELGDDCGFNLLPEVAESTNVVFLTAHETYALRAFEVNALDYLLKPVSLDRFTRCLDRMSAPSGRSDPPQPMPGGLALGDRVLVKSQGQRELLQVTDVVTVVSVGGNYTEIRTAQGTRLDVRRTIKEWEELLPDNQFVRVHRAAIVNVAYVIRLIKQAGEQAQLYLRNVPEPVCVSRRFLTRLDSELRRFGGTEWQLART